jgi:hypothetical protein
MSADGCFCSLAFCVRQALIQPSLGFTDRQDLGEGNPPSRLRRFGAASFAWLAEPKLTLRRQLA